MRLYSWLGYNSGPDGLLSLLATDIANVNLWARHNGAFASPSPCTKTWTNNLAICEGMANLPEARQNTSIPRVFQSSRTKSTRDANRGQ